MSIIIKGMDMPKSCNECMSECINIPLECYPDGDTVPDCPLVEIPTPHGRLIDGDIIDEQIGIPKKCDEDCKYWGIYCEKGSELYICDILHNAPTILEAEE